MAVKFDSQSLDSRKEQTDYKYSLSAIENAWSNIASTKEKLDFMDRRIRNATNVIIDSDLTGEPKLRQLGTTTFVRKYGRRNAGNRVKIDPNPKIGFTREDEDFRLGEYEINDHESAQGQFKRYVSGSSMPPRGHLEYLLPYGDDALARDSIIKDFDYEPHDILPSERLFTPKVPKLDSSTDKKSLLSNIKDSGAIERIRKQIKQQKENLSSPEMQALLLKPRHSESDCVLLNDDNPRGPMKRKVASSAHAPSYKGFNIPEAKETVAQTMKNVENINRKIATHKERKERVGSSHPKSKPSSRTVGKDNKGSKKDSKRSPSKMQRIVASRRPVPSITARSWRVGQEAVKKVLQAMKASKKESPVKSEDEGHSTEILSKKESGPEESDSDHGSERGGQSKKSTSQVTESSDEPISSLRSDQAKQASESKTNQESAEVSEEDSQGTDDLDKITKDLHRNNDLPTDAKTMLADLQLDQSDSEEKNLSPNVPKTTSVHSVVKSPGMKKRVKRKSPQAKRKQDDQVNRPKIRHYDQEEIQNYMAKQLAERKMKRLQEKRREKQMKLEQEQKLKELYIKQKNSLRSSLSSRHPKALGSTFTKQTPYEQRSQSSQDKSRQETAVRKLMGDGDILLFDSITEHQDKDEAARPSSPSIGESSKHERSFSVELKGNTENDDAEEQFRDSLEFDQFEAPGIKNITVKKIKDGLPVHAIPQEAGESKDFHKLARSVESEVRELLEKYKASKQIGSKSTERESEDDITTDTTDRNKLSKAERIAAISATAASLRDRLAVEANRLAYLRMNRSDEEPFASSPAPIMPTVYSTEFRGVLPGTRDLHEQAKTNEEILKKEKAATKIQAAFRGHSIRQGLTWKLPSGKTFGASLKEMRQKSAAAVSYKKQLETEDERIVSDSYTHSFDPESDVDLFSDKTSTESLIKAAENPSKPRAHVRPKFEGLKGQASRGKDEYGDSLKEIFGRTEDPKGDRYSMINVLSRRLKKAVKKDVLTDQVKMQDMEDKAGEHENASNEELYEQDFEDGEYDSLSSTIKSDVESIDERDDEQWTTIPSEKDNLRVSRLENDLPPPNVKSKKSGDLVEEDPDKTLTLLPDDLPKDEDPSVKIISYHSDIADSVRSPGRSRVSLAEESDDYEKKPNVSSNLRTTSVRQQQKHRQIEQDMSLTATSTTSDKFSPSTLERKLRAEVNQLETMDDALRQVTDMERVRGVTLAQQETVSLAQILKARQLGYKQELEQMSKDAAEQAIMSAKEVERANATAAQASENAAKRLAEIRAEAAEVVAESTKKLEEVQKEAANRAKEAADKVEKAHKMASDVAIESANRYSNDIQSVATAAASVAASSAVQAAMQVHREQLEQLRNEALKRVSKSYSQSMGSSTPTHSESVATITPSDSMTDKQESKTTEVSYGDDDFEEPSYRKSSVLEDISREGKISTDQSVVKSNTKSKSVSRSSVNEERKTDVEKSFVESIKEDVDESKFDETIQSSSKTIKTDVGKHSTPVKEGTNLQSGFEDFLQKSGIEERSFKIDDHILSSLTEDEIDDGFRMVLPVMSHRRKSLERERRSRREKALSDNGTSSDEMKRTPRSTTKHGKHSPFAGEDTFGQFTNDLVKQYIQEEEIRSTHQRALLKLREKALLEKAKAEMAWLEMQKSTLRNKGADDLMPPLNKKQRGLWLKLQSEQSEIRRLKQAYRAASHERRFMLYQQEEIVRLKEETQNIWSKLGRDKVAKSHDIGIDEKSEHTDKSFSEASSVASVDQSSVVSYDSASKSHSSSIPSKASKKSSYGPNTKSSTSTKSTKRDSKSSASTTELPEEIPSTQEQESPNTKDPSFPTYSAGNKRSPDSRIESSKIQEIEDGESTADDVSITERTQSSMMVDLRKLAKKASEEYLIKREKVLKERRSKFESILNNQLGVVDKKQRVEMEELRLKSDIKKALDKLKVKTKPLLPGTSSHEDASESSESTIKSQRISTASQTSSIKSVLSKDKSSGSESSVTEDIKATASVAADNAAFEESRESDGAHKTSKTTIPEQYGDDSFYTPSARTTVSKSISYQPDNLVTSSVRSSSKRRYSKDSDESKSEDDVSLADATSDASDIEKRIRQLEDELLKRRKDLDRIRRKRERDQLRKQEQRLKQELQAVESLIIQENINHERSITESNSLMKAPISPKIMSPKVLQAVNQHDHLNKKQSRESKTLNDAREITKFDQSGVHRSMRDKRDSSLSESANNTTNKEADEKSEKEVDTPPSGLSDEVEALRRSVQRSTEGKVSVKSIEKVVVDVIKDTGDDNIDNSVVLSSPKDRSTSPSLSVEVSVQSNKSNVSDSKKSSPKSQSASPTSTKSEDINSLSNQTKMSSRGIVDEFAKSIDSIMASHKDDSVVNQHNSEEHSDSLRSVSENICSEKSTDEEISEGRSSVSVATDIRIDEEYDDIYNDDFFESSSSTKTLQNKFKIDTQDEESIKPTLEEKKGEISSTRDEIASSSEVSSKLGSVISDSVTGKMRDNSIEENISEALSTYKSFCVNDRVIVDGMLRGTIRYIGRTSFSPVAVAGIELDEKVGNTDGKFRSKRYFTCRPDYGLFSPVANIGHLEGKDNLEKVKETKEKDVSITDGMTESVKTDIEVDLVEESILSESLNEERESQRLIREEAKKSSPRSDIIPVNEKEGSYSRSNREISYMEDFEDEEKSATAKDLTYVDDFEDVSVREERSSISRMDYSKSESHKRTSRSTASDYLPSQADLEVEEAIDKEKSYLSFDDIQSSLKKDMTAASPSPLSEVGSSDIEIVPHPPRLDLDDLAESLTDGLLKTLMTESVNITKSVMERNVNDRATVSLPSSVISPVTSPLSSPMSSLVSSSLHGSELHRNGSLKYEENELPNSVLRSSSEKSGYAIQDVKSSHISEQELDFEVSEAFISPTVRGVLQPDEDNTSIPSIREENSFLELHQVNDEQKSKIGEDALKGQEETRKKTLSSSSGVTERGIEEISRSLMLEAISQMMTIVREKNAKVVHDNSIISVDNISEEKPSEEQQKLEEKRDSEPKALLGDLPKLSVSPPKSPTEFDLEKKQSAFDTDLLAAKLSELKRMDQEIDVLLDEESDDDEQFPHISKELLPSDGAPDTIPPVRIFDFSEPIIHVPNTQKDISDIVADSAKVVASSVANGEDYDDVKPSEAFLRSDIETNGREMETSSKTLFKRMIFDVTRDLMKEVNEFKQFQTIAKQPWMRQNRRVFAKFIRQIHTLTGDELMKSFQDHISTCLGLKEGRPSLDLLKKRLPLNTSKKDYIDALLVEELREEEPNWVNYDEDEVRVKEQLTDGILESLITETVYILNQSSLR